MKRITGALNLLKQRLDPYLRPLVDAEWVSRFNVRDLAEIQIHSNRCSTPLSVAIPHYRNPEQIHLALRHLVRDRRVSEILIVDDGSPEEDFATLTTYLAPYRERIGLVRYSQNAGALVTKVQATGLCSNDWVLILDGDNTVTPGYLDAFFELEGRDSLSLYASPYPFPSFDFRDSPYGVSPGWEELLTAAGEQGKWVGALWNDGNYIVPRESFVQALTPWLKTSVAAVDVLFANYVWFSRGGRLSFLQGTHYIHRVHDRSFWKRERHTSQEATRWIRNRLKNELRVTEGPPLPVTEGVAVSREPEWVWRVEVDAVPLNA